MTLHVCGSSTAVEGARVEVVVLAMGEEEEVVAAMVEVEVAMVEVVAMGVEGATEAAEVALEVALVGVVALATAPDRRRAPGTASTGMCRPPSFGCWRWV
jgi:hypothetical protein